MIEVHIIDKATGSLVRDCVANGIQYRVIRPGRVEIADTPKGRMALRLVVERYGVGSIRVVSK